MSEQEKFYENLLLVINALTNEVKTNRAEINRLIARVDKLESQEK